MLVSPLLTILKIWEFEGCHLVLPGSDAGDLYIFLSVPEIGIVEWIHAARAVITPAGSGVRLHTRPWIFGLSL